MFSKYGIIMEGVILMRDYKLFDMAIFIFGYMCLSIIFMIVVNNFISLWLGINVILAVIPMILITVVFQRMEKNEFSFDWLSIVLLVVFVFFFPNTFYVITDLIHIDQSEFYNSDMTTYFRNIEQYIFIFHVVLTVAVGVYAGVKSLLRLNDIFERRNIDKATRTLFLFVLITLSSIGIYIGRFLRFFSWDILRPFKLINEFWASLDLFTFLFVGLFIVIHYTMYYGYRYFYEKEPF